MGADDNGFLEKAYSFQSPDEVRDFYNEWAETYERELTDNGYATPRRIAEALASFSPDKTVPLLDVGCGTGLSGQEFKTAGFTAIDGFDLSTDMLALAHGKNAYRELRIADITQPLPYAADQYPHVAVVGVFGRQHAPVSKMDDLLQLVSPGGLFAFSLNDHAYTEADGVFPKHIAELNIQGVAETLLEEYGDHIPGTGLKAWIYVMRKAG